MWGSPSPAPPPFDWKQFFNGLVLHRGLRPSELADMTLPELLLFTESKSADISLTSAIQKAKKIGALPVDQYLALARIRLANP